MKTGLTVKGKGFKKAFKSLSVIEKNNVVVGIPQSSNNRDEDGIGNAYIGYINDKGSPLQNIPARPHLSEGVQSVQDKVRSGLKRAAQQALNQKADEVIKTLDAIGLLASNAVKRYITISGFEPLAPATLRARKNRKVAKRSGEKPLIDTGEYRRSITYEVRKNES